ncbi:MAG: LacI family DNA-binding transcriptional regulator [Eubacteriales bacterium]
MAKNTNGVLLKNLAEKAGVSVGTVSLVLNGRGDEHRISKSTQQRIKEAAEEMHYTPNIYARRLRGASSELPTYVIGLFWNVNSMNWIISTFIHQLYLSSKAQNIELEIIVEPYFPGELENLKHKFNTSRFSGAIIANASDKDLEFIKENDIDLPIVTLNRDTGKYCNVSENDYIAGKKCASLFHANGHKKVGVIGMKQTSLAARLKMMGFKDSCMENSLIIKDEWILDDSRMNFEGGYEMTKKLLEGDDHPTALFVIYDYFALGVVNACKDLGYSIPDDITIMVYGNNDVFEHYSPTISSFYVTPKELAESSLDLLLLLIKHDNQTVLNKNLSPHFFFRESCKSIK